MSKLMIAKVVLVNYLRMGIKKIEYTPGMGYVLQTVLGTNGSGKSSLLWELFPLPGNDNDFGIGGRKEWHCTYAGKEYSLVSSYGSKSVHEFIVDGEDLNEGGKIEMFRSLCKEHFGIDNEVRNLLLGKERLTSMSAARRRHWMIKISDTDLSYAMDRYKKLKDNHRDIQGSIKRLQQRLVVEKSAVLADEQISLLEKEIDEIKAAIEDLYARKDNSVLSRDDANRLLVSNDEEIDSLCNQIDRLDTDVLMHSGYSTVDSMIEKRDSLVVQVKSLEGMNQIHWKNYNELKKKYDLLNRAGSETVDEIERKIKDCNDEIDFSKSLLSLKTQALGKARGCKDALDSVYVELIDKISVLPSNDGYYSSSKAKEYSDGVMVLIDSYNALQSRIARLKEDLEHKKNHLSKDENECPNCKHKWTEKISDKDIGRFEKEIQSMNESLVEMKKDIDAKRSYLTEMSGYESTYRSIMSTIRSVPILSEYFNEITQNKRLVEYPMSVVHELSTLSSDLEQWVKIDDNAASIAKLNEQMQIKKSMSADTLQSIEESMKENELLLNQNNVGIRELNKDIDSLNELIRLYRSSEQLSTRLKDRQETIRDHLGQWGRATFQELVNSSIMALQTVLARKEDAWQSASRQRAIVGDIEKSIEQSFMEERVAKMAHIALSPTNGAIAEALNRSVNSFISKINRIIKSVWNHKLELLPFEMDDTGVEMDYKFPFIKEGSTKPFKDVGDGSESMKVIFDFAFRLRAAISLGLSHIPLFLDEFESSFDDVHRQRAIYFIKQLIDEQMYGQIFMISHYESNHGALSSLSQTLVLNKDNIVLPTDIEYNTHVLIE